MLVQFAPQPLTHSFEIRGPFDLERCVAAIYYASGSQVILQGGFRPDGGVDVLALNEGRTTVVQCKHWKREPDKQERTPGVRELRELLGARVDFRASHAAFVSTNGFTDGALHFARRNAIETIDESVLQRSLSRIALTQDFQEAFSYFARTCPQCGGSLEHKTNNTTKQPFWGCANYKSDGCKYTEPYDRRMLEPRPNFKAG